MTTAEPLEETYSGRYVNPVKITPEIVSIIDIAAHLSKICRFRGACRRFYSVAEHSIHVSAVVARKFNGLGPDAVFGALLHDAAEAYLTDITRPIKAELHAYRTWEDEAAAAIERHFNLYLSTADRTAIHLADNAVLAMEAYRLMRSRGQNWRSLENVDRTLTAGMPLYCWNAETAYARFLERYTELRAGRRR